MLSPSTAQTPAGDERHRMSPPCGLKLKAKGVEFEHYRMPGMTRKGDVHIAGKMKVAWFKDPDGNILNIVSG